MEARESQGAVWTLLDVLKPAADYLEAAGVENARFDAECLLGKVLGLSRLELYLQYERSLSDDERSGFRELLKRRRDREPLQVILGDVEFLDLEFLVRPGVFIPRPETEFFAEQVLSRLDVEFPQGGDRLGSDPLRALELGVGSGVISVSLAVKRSDLEIRASDVSTDALALAAENAVRHEVSDRVDFAERMGLPESDGEPVHLIVSNPPYVRDDEADSLAPEVAKHDPAAALYGGEDGLDFYRLLAAEAPGRLATGGLLAVEIGAEQGPAVRELFAGVGLTGIEILRDYAKRDRVVIARRSS